MPFISDEIENPDNLEATFTGVDMLGALRGNMDAEEREAILQQMAEVFKKCIKKNEIDIFSKIQVAFAITLF